MRKSTNTINWTDREELPWGSPNPHMRYHSPLFYATGCHPGLQIDDGESTYLVHNPKKNAPITGKTVNYWHHTVRKLSDGKYWCIACDDSSSRKLWLLESTDYYNWIQFSPEIMSPSETGWDSKGLYKADFYVFNGKIHVYYSAYDPSEEWHVGLTVADCGLPADVLSDNVFRTGAPPPHARELTL